MRRQAEGSLLVLVKGKIDQNLWFAGVFILTPSHMTTLRTNGHHIQTASCRLLSQVTEALKALWGSSNWHLAEPPSSPPEGRENEKGKATRQRGFLGSYTTTAYSTTFTNPPRNIDLLPLPPHIVHSKQIRIYL